MKMSSVTVGTVVIKTACVPLLKDNLNRISVLYAAHLIEKVEGLTTNSKDGFTELEVYTTSYATDLLARVQRYVDDICRDGCCTATTVNSTGVVTTTTAGDDSSYDSDYDNDGGSLASLSGKLPLNQQPSIHHDVSRTTSDTLAAEYADYIQTDDCTPGYTARVEFALKLGYTERLVQAALHKLGPSPAQNELLAELIKLGAQRTLSGGGGAGSSNTTSPTSDTSGSLQSGTLDGSVSGEGTVTEGSVPVSSLRPIVIDGSNVAMSHGNKEIFSCRGIKLCVDYFQARHHREITVFVPKWRKEAPRPDNPVQDQEILAELERDRLLVFTPSRLVGGKRTVCYDDRYILKLAAEVDGVVVSNDNYRDLCQESGEYRRVVDERVLMYTFVNDRFMPPDDPLGRTGPTLDNFLRIGGRSATGTTTTPSDTSTNSSQSNSVTPPPCPYAKKCTYGNKCKYHHPERGPLPHKSVTERLSEHAQRHLQARGGGGGAGGEGTVTKQPLSRTRSVAPVTGAGGGGGHEHLAKSRSVDACGNLHRKLQRQLTLNPCGNDPRLLSHLHHTSPQTLHTPQPPQQHYYPNSPPPYWDHPSPSSPSSTTPPPSSQPSNSTTPQQYLHHFHQHVTRIASAPDSTTKSQSTSSPGNQLYYHGYPSNHGNHPFITRHNTLYTTSNPATLLGNATRHSPVLSGGNGCSGAGGGGGVATSQQLLWPSSGVTSISEPQLWPPPPQPVAPPGREDARRKLHYHLAAIFPEELVVRAMRLYPEETNPQKICAAILALQFPKQ